MRKFLVWAACCVAFVSGAAHLASAEGNAQSPQAATLGADSDERAPATQALLTAYPGLRIHTIGNAIRAFYGKPMTAGNAPEDAVHAFWAAHREAFGVPGLELVPHFSNDVSWGTFTVFAYTQRMGGLPVEYSAGRVLVLNGVTDRVVYAAGIYAQPPEGGFARAAVSGEQALAHVQAMLPYRQLGIWSAPQLIAYAGTEAEMADGSFGPTVQAWKFTGDNGDLASRAKLTFYVDASSGRLLTVFNNILHVDVSGTARGNGSPGMLPDIPANPPALMAMPEIRVSITGVSTVFGDRDGNFTIPHGGTTSVTVTSSVANGATTGGRWVYVNNSAGVEITASATVTPPGPANLKFNETPAALTTAQVNAFVHGNLIHNFITDRTSWTGMNFVMPANVNIAQTCNAYYDFASINFFQAGDGCPNSAYSSAVAHEYGHAIVNELGLSQGAFGEGFGDCCSVLLYDDPVVARNFFGDSPWRDYSPGQPEDPWPCAAGCDGEPHCCGEILAGMWWDIREQFGSSPGLSAVQQLFVDWSQLTLGGSGSNSAHPQTVVEILTADDDDGDLGNGTPNYALICAASSAHALPCPPLTLVTFEFPGGVPTTLAPGIPTNIAVNVLPITATPTPGTGTVSYRINGGPFTTVAMDQGALNQYTAMLPGTACGDGVDFYFSSATSGGVASSPTGAPATTHSAASAYGLIDVLTDNFQTNLGWLVGPGDTAATGIWTRVDPNRTPAQPEDDHTPAPGTICWVTGQGAVGGGPNENDVDRGFTRLTSPALDFEGATGATVEYWRWYSNDQGAAPNTDIFRVEITNDGTTWVALETVGPAGPETAGGWYFRSFNAANFVALTSNVRVRFTAEDAGSFSAVEAAVDDFRAFSLDCTPSTPCPGDLDGDGSIGLADLSVLLSNFGTASGAGPEDGDMTGDGSVDLADLGALLANFGNTCP